MASVGGCSYLRAPKGGLLRSAQGLTAASRLPFSSWTAGGTSGHSCSLFLPGGTGYEPDLQKGSWTSSPPKERPARGHTEQMVVKSDLGQGSQTLCKGEGREPLRLGRPHVQVSDTVLPCNAVAVRGTCCVPTELFVNTKTRMSHNFHMSLLFFQILKI